MGALIVFLGLTSPLHVPAPPGASFVTIGKKWAFALERGLRWPLPLDGDLTPRRIDAAPPLYRVLVTQHAFTAREIDQDGDWLLLCDGRGCSEPIPVDVRDHSKGVDVSVAAEVTTSPDGAFDVVFTRVRVVGDCARAAAWRARVESWSGHHARLR